MFNSFNPWGILFKHCQRQKNLLFNIWVAWDGFMWVVDALTVSWIFSVLGSHRRRRKTLASYWTASNIKYGLCFPNRRKWLHSYLDVFQFYSFLINVLWLLAPSITGPYGNLVQDDVSFNKINYLTIVISIFVSQGILPGSIVTSGHLNL